jgi:hypothetical protein
MYDWLACLRRYDFYPWLGCKLQMNLAPEAGVSQGMVDFDVKVRRPACCRCIPQAWMSPGSCCAAVALGQHDSKEENVP